MDNGDKPTPFRPNAGPKGSAAFSSASLPVDKGRRPFARPPSSARRQRSSAYRQGHLPRRPCCHNRRRAKSAPSVHKDRPTDHRQASPLGPTPCSAGLVALLRHKKAAWRGIALKAAVRPFIWPLVADRVIRQWCRSFHTLPARPGAARNHR